MIFYLTKLYNGILFLIYPVYLQVSLFYQYLFTYSRDPITFITFNPFTSFANSVKSNVPELSTLLCFPRGEKELMIVTGQWFEKCTVTVVLLFIMLYCFT